MVWIQKNGQLIHVYGDAAQLNEDGTYTIVEHGEGPEIRAAKARRAALLEEVVEMIESRYEMIIAAIREREWREGKYLVDESKNATTEKNNLIARVRAEWGTRTNDQDTQC